MKIYSQNKGFTHTPKFIKLGWFGFFKNKNNKSSNIIAESKTLVGGFTLVETLVAVAIFATSITALISITARGINDNVFVKNKLIAAYLAQEGVELVRNMRDNSILANGGAGVGWDEFLTNTNDWIGHCYSDSLSAVNACTIDGAVNEVFASECMEGTCLPIGFDESSSTYTYGVIFNSPFTRTIKVRPIESGSNNEVIVISIVEWTQGSNTHNVSYQYNLLNWFNP